MSKHPHSSLHLSAVGFIAAGIVVLSSASQEVLFAQGTSQGSRVIQEISRVEKLLPGNHGVALQPVQKSAARELAIGSMLILVGFFFHALLTLRTEHPVKVIAGTKKRQPRIRIQEIYWMEIIPRRK